MCNLVCETEKNIKLPMKWNYNRDLGQIAYVKTYTEEKNTAAGINIMGTDHPTVGN